MRSSRRSGRSYQSTSENRPNLRSCSLKCATRRKPNRWWSATDASLGRAIPATARCTSSETIRRVVDETLTVYRVEEPESAGGGHRASIISLASVADVGMRGGDAELDPRRFRMLIELDGVEAYAEDGWQGRRLRIGDAVVRLGQRIPRCVMTTLSPDTGENDFDTLKVLAQHRKVGTELLLGVYGDVEEPGRIAVGDVVRTRRLTAAGVADTR